MLIHFPALAALLASGSSSSSKTTNGGSPVFFIFILVLFGAMYFLFLRPRSQQAKRQREEMQAVSVGDEVLTGAGIFGTIVGIEGDRVELETGPGSRITVLRSTIARRMTEPEPSSGEGDDWDDTGDTPRASGKSLGGGSKNGDARTGADGGAAPGANGRAGDSQSDEGSGEGSARAGEGG
jgi:preprotein translocase subunit YajC